MPPKPKFTKEEITAAALELVAERGIEALTARELGNALGSSARPIFTVFKNMEELQTEVHLAVMRRFESYAEEFETDMPMLKQVGMKMILFGIHEPKLYQLLFMQDNQKITSFDDLFGTLGKTARLCMETIEQDYHLSEEKAKMLFESLWIYTFGIGTLCATGVCRFSKEQLGQMLTTEFQAMMLLIQSQIKEEAGEQR